MRMLAVAAAAVVIGACGLAEATQDCGDPVALRSADLVRG
jgi:hypothetical protein